MTEQQIDAGAVIAGYQQALADANHRALTADAGRLAALAELAQLRAQLEAAGGAA